MRFRWLVGMVVLGGCGDDNCCTTDARIADAGVDAPVADPRIEVASISAVPKFLRNTVQDSCQPDLSIPLINIANKLRGMVGDTCLTGVIAMPPDCVVTDVTALGSRVLPPCGSGSGDCYTFVVDTSQCLSFDHLRVDVTRTSPPCDDTVTTVRCIVP